MDPSVLELKRVVGTRPWLTGVGLFAVLGGLMIAAAVLWLDWSTPHHLPERRVLAVPMPIPRPDDSEVLLNNTPLAIAPTDAIALNAARPLDRRSVVAARPFLLAAALPVGADPATGPEAAALDCLTQAIYYEAASESDTGERAVAQVVLNRVRNPLFPHSVCGAVFQGSERPTGCQFSFTCDGSLHRRPSADGWARARRIAAAALAGRVEPSVGLSTHYHANFVVPYWASSLDKVKTIGAHIFYVMRGGRGRPASFTERYDAAAEVPPTLSLTLTGLDEAVTDGAGGLVVPALRDRTEVREDALGAPKATTAAPTAAAIAPAAPQGRLRADETAGELILDRTAPAGPR